jgi:hypothetical protein
MKKLLPTIALLAFTGVCIAQTTWTMNFGTTTGSFGVTNAEIFSNVDRAPALNVPAPTPASSPVQIARIRVGTTAQLGSFSLASTGVTLGSDARLRSVAPNSTSSNKFSIYDIPATTGLMAFSVRVRFDAGTDGEQILSIGNNDSGSFYNNGSGLTTQGFASMQWNLGATKHTFSFFDNTTSNTSTTAISAILNPAIDAFTPNSEHTIEMYCNNTAAPINYLRNAVSYTLGANKWQMWVNGVRIFSAAAVADFGTNILPSKSGAANNLNAFAFNSKSSATQAVTFLDDIVYTDGLVLPANAITLPVTLTSFTAIKQANSVQLKWNTASEQNNSHFDVQRSTDGKDFLNIGKVTGAGNSNASLNYYFTDNRPSSGVSYYRLNQVDFDGKSTLINPISVNMGFNDVSMTVSNIPNSSSLSINFSANQASSGQLIIYNISGQKVYEKAVNLTSGINVLTVNLLTEDKGIFIATLNNGTQTLREKFVK